jgi:phosphonate transport system substrate-binding protein
LYAPYRRETDASATGLMLWTKADENVRAEQVEIGRTHSVPGFMIMAHPRMPPAKIKCVRALLLDFHNTPEGKAYLQANEFIDFQTIDDKTMMSLDPYTQILTDPAT